MKESDWSTFQQLDAELFPEERIERKGRFDRMVKTDGFFGLLSSSDQLIGCLYLNRFGEDAGHLGRIGVAKSEQGKGLGKRLMEFALNWFHKQGGIQRIHLYTQDFNKTAQRLYEKFGFKRSGTTWHFFVPYSTLTPNHVHACQPIQPDEISFVSNRYGNSMPKAQIHRWLEREDLVLTLKTQKGQIIGACRFTPSFPGCFPFEIESNTMLDDFLDGLRAYALPEFDYIRVTFTDNPNLAKLLKKRKCRLHHRLYKMTLELS